MAYAVVPSTLCMDRTPRFWTNDATVTQSVNNDITFDDKTTRNDNYVDRVARERECNGCIEVWGDTCPACKCQSCTDEQFKACGCVERWICVPLFTVGSFCAVLCVATKLQGNRLR